MRTTRQPSRDSVSSARGAIIPITRATSFTTAPGGKAEPFAAGCAGAVRPTGNGVTGRSAIAVVL